MKKNKFILLIIKIINICLNFNQINFCNKENKQKVHENKKKNLKSLFLNVVFLRLVIFYVTRI